MFGEEVDSSGMTIRILLAPVHSFCMLSSALQYSLITADLSTISFSLKPL